MKKNILSLAFVSTLLIASAGAMAQAPSNAAVPAAASSAATVSTTGSVSAPSQAGRYVGPSSTAMGTVKQLLATGKDDQYARLQGKITSHDHEKKYTFTDDSGSMTVEISPKRFPEGATISADQRVELAGKLDKGWNKVKFEVKELRLLP